MAKNYKILSKIGNGAFGEIYKARHLKSNQDIAIKFEDSRNRHQ